MQPEMQWNRICPVEKNVEVGDRRVEEEGRRGGKDERGEALI